MARLCEERIKGRFKIETVDVLEDSPTAHENNVLVTPTLILVKPLPKVTVLGNLNDASRVSTALRVSTTKFDGS